MSDRPLPLQKRFVNAFFFNQSMDAQNVNEEKATSPMVRALAEDRIVQVLRESAVPMTEHDIFHRLASELNVWPDWMLAGLLKAGRVVQVLEPDPSNNDFVGYYTTKWTVRRKPLRPYFEDDGTFIHKSDAKADHSG